jgi:hypothetical protein
MVYDEGTRVRSHTPEEILHWVRFWRALRNPVEVECGSDVMETFRDLHAPRLERHSTSRVRFELWDLPYRTDTLDEPFDLIAPGDPMYPHALYEMVGVTRWNWFGWPRCRYFAVVRHRL